MIRDPEDNKIEHMSITVTLKSGVVHRGCDTTSTPFGKDDKVVFAWTNENTLTLFPLDVVGRVDIHFPDMDEEKTSEF